MIKENLVFFKNFINEFKATGSICPTSRWAAERLISPLRNRKSREPLKILELGPGTGSVTIPLLQSMQPNDQLTICEINPIFMNLLKERLAEDTDYARHKDKIRFFNCPMQELPENETYDVIICAIPFLNFEIEMVGEIFAKLSRISRPDTIMSYYEYIGLRSLGKVVSLPQRRARMKQIDSFFCKVFENHLSDRHRVFLNVLPINVYLLKDLASLKIAA